MYIKFNAAAMFFKMAAKTWVVMVLFPPKGDHLKPWPRKHIHFGTRIITKQNWYIHYFWRSYMYCGDHVFQNGRQNGSCDGIISMKLTLESLTLKIFTLASESWNTSITLKILYVLYTRQLCFQNGRQNGSYDGTIPSKMTSLESSTLKTYTQH